MERRSPNLLAMDPSRLQAIPLVPILGDGESRALRARFSPANDEHLLDAYSRVVTERPSG
jgi:hypothetical protein